MYPSSDGVGDITKAITDNPSAMKKWLKIRRGQSTTEPAPQAESIIEGATPASIAEYAADLKARKNAESLQVSNTKRRRRWRRR